MSAEVLLKPHPRRLRLRHPFTTTHGTRHALDTLIVEATDGHLSGFGEAPVIDYYGVTAEGLARFIETDGPATLKDLHNVSTSAAKPSPNSPAPSGIETFARCAIEEAWFDLAARRADQTVRDQLARHLPLLPGPIARSCYTLGHDTPDAMLAKLRERPRFPAYKVKLIDAAGLDLLRRLRLATTAALRVDANGAWTAPQALDILPQLADLGVDLLEQPLPRGRELEMPDVLEAARRAAIPVIADESCHTLADLPRCAAAFDGVNIKLSKCGGFREAITIVAEARRRRMKVMIGCMTESTVGISAAAQLAPFADYLDLDGALLLAEDAATGVRIADDGTVHFPNSPGTGVHLTP